MKEAHRTNGKIQEYQQTMEYSHQKKESVIQCTKVLMECYRKASYHNNMITVASGKNNKDLGIMHFLDQTVENLRQFHSKGERLYYTLFYSYMTHARYTNLQLREHIGQAIQGYPLSRTTLYRWQRNALGELGLIVWSQNVRRVESFVDFMFRYNGSLMNVSQVSEFLS